ncbi:MAG: 1,4-alpha-glucan branching protein GlgB, partial [Actinobacteria bacterium]|nr:1,4-alpha-glucan branching protein GlgB [Actinomycetota bacterium]
GWAGGDSLARQGESGIWAGEFAGAQAGHRYRFGIRSVDGAYTVKADPMARYAEGAPSNASVVVAPSQFRWTDDDWMRGRSHAATTPLRIYEVHLGSWRSGARTYLELGDQLADHVTGLGFTHVEFLPIAEHPFGGSWGYQVTGYYAPTSRYGTPDELRAMIDVLHARGIGVIVDWVPAHFPKDEWALARFDGTPLYEHANPQRGEHPDWGTYVFDFGRAEVRNFLVANALYWLHEFHIDGLRVDAVTSMLYLDYSRADGEWLPNKFGGKENLEAIEFVRELTNVVAQESPTAMMIAEESTAFPRITHPVADGGLGFTHKWNLGWMNDTLGYLRHVPGRRPPHHRELTFGLTYAFHERFVLPLSHDEVVHGKGSLLGKMPGSDSNRFANLRALYAWMWALPGAPLLFMGAELAPLSEWSDAAELPWQLLEDPRNRGVRDLIVELNRLSVLWPAVYERDQEAAGFEWLDADNASNSTYAFLRVGRDGGTAVACVASFSPKRHERYRVGLPWPGPWQLLLDSNSTSFGGERTAAPGRRVTADGERPWQRQPASVVLDVPPLGVLWLGGERPS